VEKFLNPYSGRFKPRKRFNALTLQLLKFIVQVALSRPSPLAA
jgi:hypothetical protein